MNQSLSLALSELLGRAGAGSTGALEIRDGKKKWVFFLEQGALVGSRSNLKSEQPEAVAEAHPGLPAEELAAQLSWRRLRGACKAELPEQGWEGGAVPPQRVPAALGPLVSRLLGELASPAELEGELAPLLKGQPRVVSAPMDLGMGELLQDYLSLLDGMRPGADVLDFAPAARESALVGLWMGWKGGWLSPEGEAPRPSSAPAAVAAPVVAAPRRPEAPKGEAPRVSEPVARTVEPPRAPEPAPEPEGHVVAGIPGRGRGAGKHPLEDRLRELAVRFEKAAHHFEAFGLPWDSEAGAFRKAHLEFAQALHPDRFADASPELQELATATFDRERAAWEVLSNDDRRVAYIDRVIHGKKTEDELAMEQVQAYWAAEGEFKKGLAMYNNGRLPAAHEHFKAASERMPDELEFKAWFGYTTFALNQKRDKDLAESGLGMIKEVLEKNKEQERKLDSAWALFGKAAAAQGNNELAKRALIQALKINPNNGEAARELKRITGVDVTAPKKEESKKEEPKKEEKKGFFASLFGRK